MNFEELLENYFVPKGEKWINLGIKTIQGECFDLGRTYLSESIDSITKNIKKKLEYPSFYTVILIFRGNGLEGKRTLKDYESVLLNFICNDEDTAFFHLMIRLRGGGGGIMGLPFVDVEKSEIRKLKFGEAPEYREVIRGLNFFGKCKNKKCRIKDDIFTIEIGKGTFDYFKLMEDDKFVCPKCNYPITPDTCGFWDCKYEIKGEGKGKDKKIKTFSRSGVAGEDDFEYFDPAGEFKDKVIYCSLVFKVS